EHRRLLLSLIALAAGKPLLLADDYALSPRALLEASAQAEITLAVPPREDLEGLGLAELETELRSVETECLENDVACELPRLAVALVAVPEQEAAGARAE